MSQCVPDLQACAGINTPSDHAVVAIECLVIVLAIGSGFYLVTQILAKRKPIHLAMLLLCFVAVAWSSMDFLYIIMLNRNPVLSLGKAVTSVLLQLLFVLTCTEAKFGILASVRFVVPYGYKRYFYSIATVIIVAFNIPYLLYRGMPEPSLWIGLFYMIFTTLSFLF
ncbi:hypothetical protein HDU91_000300, partial [Kappamyces sp. JEL0680]